MSSPVAAIDARARALAGYRTLLRRRLVVVAALALTAALGLVLDATLGPSDLTLAQVWGAITAPAELGSQVVVIVREVRLPQALMAVLVGAALAVAGVELQTVLAEPLASPTTLGISAGAAFGAALAIVLGVGMLPGAGASWAVTCNAFVFAFGSVLLLQAVARLRGAGPETLVLFGIALVFGFDALVALLQFVASAEALQQLVFWTLGSLGRATWGKLEVLAMLLAATLPFSLAAAWRLTALRLGEDRARSLGVDARRVRFWALLRISLLAGAAVAFVGIVGFVGLVAPHIARLLVGEDHRFLLPTSALAGGALLSLASVASKAVLPGVVIPLGIVTSLIGLPLFVGLVLRRRRV